MQVLQSEVTLTTHNVTHLPKYLHPVKQDKNNESIQQFVPLTNALVMAPSFSLMEHQHFEGKKVIHACLQSVSSEMK
jgi:hypothetical protein